MKRPYSSVLIAGLVVFAALVLTGISLWPHGGAIFRVQAPQAAPPATGWQTYTSQAMGLSFRYPSDWILWGEAPDRRGRRIDFTSQENQRPYVELVILRGETSGFLGSIDDVRRDAQKNVNPYEEEIAIGGSLVTMVSYTHYVAGENVRENYVYEPTHGIWVSFRIHEGDSTQNDNGTATLRAVLATFAFAS